MMLDPIQVVQDAEALLDSHYLALIESLPLPTTTAPLTPQPVGHTPALSPAKPTGVTELLGNLAFLLVLSVLDQSMARPAAR